MPESGPLGSVRGDRGNPVLYRDNHVGADGYRYIQPVLRGHLGGTTHIVRGEPTVDRRIQVVPGLSGQCPVGVGSRFAARSIFHKK